ncbi:MAG: hypothetical protein GY780_11280, partial [bacterium]|nr:hypothetical protein [bacterium]
PAFEHLTGLKADDIIGKTIREVVPPIEDTWIQRFGQVALTGEPDYFENHSQGLDKSYEVTAFSPSPNHFACIFVDVTERLKNEELLANHRDRLKSLNSRLSNAEELFRQDIAAGLHDSLGQDLAALKLNVDLLRLGKGKNSHPISEQTETAMKQISDSLNEVVKKIWSLSFQLCPPGLFNAGLVPTLEWLVGQFNNQHEASFQLHAETQHPPLNKQARGSLFQMIRELLVNSVKHGNPDNISIVITQDSNNLLVSVIDDGVGFDVMEIMNSTQATSGFGLFSIRERLSFFSGSLNIESDSQIGTTVKISFPLEIPSLNESGGQL